MMFVIKN